MDNALELAGRLTRMLAASAITVALVAGCTGSEPGSSSPSTSVAEPTTSTGPSTEPSTTDPFADPIVEGTFTISDGRALNLTCWGSGSPTIILEPGDTDGGVARFQNSPIARMLAESNQVCAYDRAGLGNSDDPPDRPRTMVDLANDLAEVLAVAQVEPPYVYVGSSFGGPIAMQFAALYPADVAGVVLLDVPSDTDEEGNPMTYLDLPAWDDPANVEHVDFSVPFERPNINAPLVVVTASGGQSSEEDQSYWLAFSPEAEQIVLDGGHVIYRDNADGVAEAVTSLLERLPD